MNISTIEFTKNEEEESVSLNCPICGHVWYSIIDEQAGFESSCDHLCFVWEQAGEIEFYNEDTEKVLADEAVKVYKQIYGDDSLPDLKENSEIFNEIFLDNDVWSKINIKEVDELLDQTQEGMCCGPSSYTVLFGVKK